MRMRILFASAVMALFAWSACNREHPVANPEKNFLLRATECAWVSKGDSAEYTEQWKWVNDSLLTSTGFMLRGSDTLFSEKVTIKAGKKTRQYIPQVKDQNGGAPVVFNITTFNDTAMVAENPQHDFPQRIVYTLKTDSLIAYIEGKTANGGLHREYFRMCRKK